MFAFDGFDGLKSKDANDFLKRDKNLTYIEHLISEKKTELERFQQVLTQYVTLIQPDDALHQLALEKFSRCVCLYMLETLELDELSRIKSTLENYFPFYVGTFFKPDWLIAYNAQNKTPEMMQHMFARESIRVKVGQCVKSLGIFANLDLIQIQKDIIAMANDPFFSTHQHSTLHVINTFSAAGGSLMRKIPGLCHLNTLANKVANATGQSLEVPTARKSILLSYAERVLGILSDDLRHISQKQKLIHVELLSIFFVSGNDALQNDIAEKATKIILRERDNVELLVHFLKNIAPEPLGLQCYGLHAKPDMLPKLSMDANEILLSSLGHTEKVTSAVNIDWSGNSKEDVEWLAYIACMGNLPQVSKVRITFETLTRRQTLLLLHLMGSRKLVIAAADPVSVARMSTIAGYTPECTYDVTHNPQAGLAAIGVTQHALAYGRQVTHIQITDPEDKTIETIMKDTHCFQKVVPGAYAHYSLHFSRSEHCKCVEFQLSHTSIKPIGNTITTERQREKLLGYIIDFFSRNWKEALIVDEDHLLVKSRPLAIPASALSDHEQQEEVREFICKHRHLHLLFFEQPEEGKNFLYDILLFPLDPVTLRPGPFTVTGDALALAVHDFPELQISVTQRSTLRLSQVARETGGSSSAAMKAIL